MSFQPVRLPPETWTFRGLTGSLKRNLWASKVKAFLRKPKDDDGITVVPEPCLCCALDISGIGKIKVEDIESFHNPATNDQLQVFQDAEDHAVILHVPYHHEHEKEAQDLANDLAEMCTLLGEKEFEAKEEWATRCPASSGGSASDLPASRHA
jgi:hypothetical protein